MKWIKYQIVCGKNENEEDILLDKKIGYSNENLAIAEEEAYNGVYTIEEDSEQIAKNPIAVELGGTGATTAADARTNLNVYSKEEVDDKVKNADASDRVSKFGDTMSGILVAQNNTSYTTKQVRNIFLIADGTSLPSGADGDICLIYAP